MLALAQNTNLAVRFLLELVVLAAVSYAAWRLIEPVAPRVLLAVTLPAAVAVLWATLVHGAGVPGWISVTAQVAVFAAAAAALAATQHVRLASAFVATAAINAALMTAWSQ